MGRRVVGLEDIFLILGALLASVGAGIQFGYPTGLMVGGVLFLLYGIWITKPPESED